MATDLAFNFQDEWNPVTGVPDLGSLTLNDTTDKSKYWVAVEAGSSPVGVPPVGDPPEVPPGVTIDYAVGDGVAWNGEKWVKIPASDLALSKVMALEDVILSTETIGNEPALPITTSVTSETNCYVDNSVFTKWGILKEVKIFTRALGAFYLLHFRKDGTNKWTELNRYALTTASSTDYTSFSAASLDSEPIHIEPGDCFGFLKRVDTPNPSASVGKLDNVTGKFTQNATVGGDGKFTFTSASFPGSGSGSYVPGRQLALEIFSEVNAVVQNSKDIAALQTAVGQNTTSIGTLTTGLATANTNIGQNTTSIGTLTTGLATANTNIGQNTTNIGTLTTGLATANTNIGTLTSDLATAKTDITQNTTNIGTLTSDLATANTEIIQNTTDIGTLTTGLATANTKITNNTTDITALKSEIFVVPSDFDWNIPGNVSPLKNTECIISNEFDISSAINLPVGIRLKFLPCGKFNTAVSNKMPIFNMSAATGWTSSTGTSFTEDPHTFSTEGDGRVRKAGVLQTGAAFRIRIKGSTTATFVQVLDVSSTTRFTPVLKGTFDITVTTIYTGPDNIITIRAGSEGTTTIDIFEVWQGGYIQSKAAYGDLDEQKYPVIDNASGDNFIDGGVLSGMFKAGGDVIKMSDYFAANSYPARFFDSFVKTKFIIDKDLTQTGYDYSSINVGITDATYKNYKGLSEGCGIEGVEGFTLNDLYLYATGDFYIKNLAVNNGRVSICNFYHRPLTLSVTGCTFTNVSIDNKQAHTAAVSVILQADISNSDFTINLAEPPSRNVFWFLSVINSRISNCRFAFPNYRPADPSTGFTGDTGQPIALQSSINSVYENNIMDNGDSGLMFCFTGLNTDGYSAWIEGKRMDFKGFENNIIRGNTMYNMTEEAFTCDSTDSSYPTLTMNRNRFEIVSVGADNRTAVVDLKTAEGTTYDSLVNTMMTSITDGKFGKYCKIVKIEQVAGDTTNRRFTITGSTDFFKNAVQHDQYAVTYAFFNNIIENNSFVNCCVPVLLYLYAFHNTVRGNSVFGGNNLKGVGNMRVLSYSARRERCYIAPSIDNVFENNVMVNNGLHILCSKNKTEWPNDWLTGNPEPFDGTITRDADLNTVIRGNVFKDTAIKLQGLTGCIFENNQLINTPTEITDTSFYSEMGNLINESDNIGIDNLFARAEAAGNTLIPLISRGNGTGFIRLKIGATGDIAVSVNGNAFLYDSETGTTGSRHKTYTPASGEVLVYARCLSGDAQLIISNAFNISSLGKDNNDLLLKYDQVNSPDVYMLKSRFLPKNITSIKQTTTDYGINLRGNVSNLPNGLVSLNIDDSKGSLMDGYIKDLPRSLTSIHLKNPLLWSYTVAFRGNLVDLPANCTLFHDETGSGVYTYSQRTWPSGMSEVYIRLSSKHFWTCDMVDQLLIDLSNATWADNGILVLSEASLNPKIRRSSSPASLAAVDLLHSNGVITTLPKIGTTQECSDLIIG